MPYKPKQPCRHPGCPRLVPYGKDYCEEHAPLHARPAEARGYGPRWRKASRAFLRAHPFCAECLRHNRVTRATVVDHVKPHRGDRELFWDEGNWQPLCKKCHDRKTMTEDRYEEYRY